MIDRGEFMEGRRATRSEALKCGGQNSPQQTLPQLLVMESKLSKQAPPI